MSDYYSGIKVYDASDTINPAEINGNSVIGLVGTCTNAPEDFPAEAPQNSSKTRVLISGKPYLVTSRKIAKQFDGSIRKSLDLIYKQSGGKVVVIRADDVDSYETAIEAFLEAKAETNFSPEFLLAPMNAQEMEWPSAAVKEKAVKEAERLEVITEEKKNLLDQAAQDLSEDSENEELILAQQEAREAWETAKAASDSARTHADKLSSTNPRYEVVGMKLKEIALKIDAIPIFDVPKAATTNMPASLQGFWCQPCWPFVKVPGEQEPQPMAPLVAGMYVKTDRDTSTGGFWETPSNRPVSGITGLETIVPYRDDDPECLANLLGAARITTIIRDGDFKLWNAARGLFDPSRDKKWQFIPVVRTWRVIKRMLKESHKWAIARGIRKNLIQEIEVSATEGMKRLRNMGAIIDGECIRDLDAMTDEEIMEGNLHFKAKFTPVYITQRITFGLAVTNEYLKGLRSNGNS